MSLLNKFNTINSDAVAKAAKKYGTPLYLYDERLIAEKCERLASMPNAYGLAVRYAMKANPTRAILRIIREHGLKIDASSMNEARRALASGAACRDVMLTTQETPADRDYDDLCDLMLNGMKYNVCSLRQLYNIGSFASENGIALAMRVHPGVGSGESATRNTGDNYCCFGIHISDLDRALDYAKNKGLVIDHLHAHIGSGADPVIWRENIDIELDLAEKYFPDVQTVSFGGGLREARMPDETPADVWELCAGAKDRIERFYKKTGRRLKMEIEPGTFVMANAGVIVTSVIDKKKHRRRRRMQW